MSTSQAAETKKIIVSVLTSNPLRCTLRQLCDDFSNIVGYRIPIRQLGFNNVEDYLRSIPDICQVFGSGQMAEVQGVIKPNSAHIGAMVVKQRKTSIPAHKKKFIKTLPSPQQQSSSGPPRNNNVRYRAKSNATNSKETIKTNNENERDNDGNFCTLQENSTKVPANVQNQLCKLISNFPNGLWCIDLPNEYFKMYKTPLRFERYEYLSLIAMCADLPQIFNYVKPTSEDFVLYHKNNQIPSLNQNEAILNSPIIDNTARGMLHKFSKLNWFNGLEAVPTNVVPLGHVIPQYFPDDLSEGDHFDVVVGEIYTISKFFVYPTYGQLESLMEKLQQFFQRQRNQYLIPDLLLDEGLYCTVMHHNNYHRCVIVDLLPDNPQLLRVLFIDYGSVGDVSKNEIYYLPEEFADVPCQAIKARLAHIQPTDQHILEKFRDFINKTLVADIVLVNKKEKILDIYLADITDENNIFFINDILVEKGYAFYVDQKALSE